MTAPTAERGPGPAPSPLAELGVLGRPTDPEIVAVARIAATLCGVSTASVNLLDDACQYTHVTVGFEGRTIPREHSLCATTVDLGAAVYVPDLALDHRFADNPFVDGRYARARFYAAAPVVSADGAVLGTLCVFDQQPRTLTLDQRAALVDLAGQVTALFERHSQAAALRESEQRMQALLAHTEAAVYAKDYRPGREGRYVIANAALGRLVGRAPERILGSTDADLHPRTEAQALRAHDAQVLASGVQHFEETLELPDGSLRRYHSTKFPLLDDDGRAYAVAGLSTDLTATLAAKAELEASENRWRTLVQLAPEAVLVLHHGRVTFANPTAATLLAATGAEHLLGTDLTELVHPEDDPAPLLDLVLGEVARDVPLRLQRLDGVYRDVDASSAGVVHQGLPAVQVVIRDVTEARQAQTDLAAAHAALAERQAFTEALLQSVEVGIVACDADGHLTLFNAITRSWHGLGPDDSLDPAEHAEVYRLLHPDGSTVLRPEEVPLRRAFVEGSIRDAEIVIAPHGGPVTRVVTHGRALTGPDGAQLGAVVAMHDVTALRARESALAESEARFRTSFDAAPIGMALTSTAGEFLQVNTALASYLGYTVPELLALGPRVITHPDDRDRTAELAERIVAGETATLRQEKRYLRSDGTEVWGMLSVTGITGPEGASLVLAQVEDLTERRRAEERLAAQALHDGLTGLPNRAKLLDRLERVLRTRARRPVAGRVDALLFCDLDGFKQVNDTLGHAAGDALLVEMARRLGTAVRPGDTVARLGGDEFVVLLENLTGTEEAHVVAHRLDRMVSVPFAIGSDVVEVTASVGIAFARPGLDADGLLRGADQAMYRAKQLGKDRVEVFDEGLAALADTRLRVDDLLRRLAEPGVLVVHYQPVVDLHTGAVEAVEALARLRGDDGRLVPPSDFIALAEESDLIVTLGEAVLRQACAQVARWRATVSPDLRLSVNLSARQAARPTLAESVLGVLAAAGLPPEAVCLELTETALLAAGPGTLRQLTALRDAGAGIGIDDFGTGYASLRYLRELPVSFLKIDRSFVAGLPDDAEDSTIVTAVANLARDLGLDCVVEGVETAEQLSVVQRLSARTAQGYLLARPAAAEDIEDLLATLLLTPDPPA